MFNQTKGISLISPQFTAIDGLAFDGYLNSEMAK